MGVLLALMCTPQPQECQHFLAVPTCFWFQDDIILVHDDDDELAAETSHPSEPSQSSEVRQPPVTQPAENAPKKRRRLVLI